MIQYLFDRCTRQSECSTGSLEWVSNSAELCPVISSANPSIIYMQELKVVDLVILVAKLEMKLRSISRVSVIARWEVLIYT